MIPIKRKRATEKVRRYYERTLAHIHRVQNNMFTLLVNYRIDLGLTDEDCRRLAEQVLLHDRSKFNEIQYKPYIELTEYYHQRKALGNKDYEYPSEEMKAKVNEAVENHYACENHHVERYGKNVACLSDGELIEVVCDLQAMAQEFNEGSCRGFFENVWAPKYELKKDSRIYGLMDHIIRCFEHEMKIDD